MNDYIRKINWKKWIERGKKVGVMRLALLIIAGVLLLLSSFGGQENKKEEKKSETKQLEQLEEYQLNTYIENMESRLTNVLSQVDGIGKVQVMITAKSTQEKVVLKDVPYKKSTVKEQDGSGTTKESTEMTGEEGTVLEKQQDGSENPYITKEIQPEIEGVIVIAQGAEEKRIQAEINDAVVALFSVPSHKIKVMKMKK
ncbi:MAG: stage III sporulation protein AG [Lachnospiraceae bacterium]|nr:stage III sporulation protein AG [Lachnospiraceae bacterium]